MAVEKTYHASGDPLERKVRGETMEWKPVTEMPAINKEELCVRSAPLILWGSFGCWARGEYVGHNEAGAEFRTCPYIPIGDITHWAKPEAPNVKLSAGERREEKP